MTEPILRCWGDEDELMASYHDDEWGRPVHDDNRHFEMVILDGFQAGLSWRTILNKRENFRAAFARFDPFKVAKFTDADVAKLLEDKGIIRNRLKVNAAITNAKAFLEVQTVYGSFDKYIWQFTDNKTIRPSKAYLDLTDMPASSPESDAMSADLKKRGFKFVGTTICYAYMQAAGMVNDHMDHCPLFGKELPPAT